MALPSWAFQVEHIVPAPSEELICSICQSVFNVPMQGPCDHVFCECCIQRWLEIHRNCPICRKVLRPRSLQPVNPLIRNIILKLTVICKNKNNGCQEQFPIERSLTHETLCLFEKLECPRHCGSSFLRRDSDLHLNELCPNLVTICPTCGAICSRIIGDHNCVELLKKKLEAAEQKVKEGEAEIERLKALLALRSQRMSSAIDLFSISDDSLSNSDSVHSLDNDANNHDSYAENIVLDDSNNNDVPLVELISTFSNDEASFSPWNSTQASGINQAEENSDNDSIESLPISVDNNDYISEPEDIEVSIQLEVAANNNEEEPSHDLGHSSSSNGDSSFNSTYSSADMLRRRDYTPSTNFHVDLFTAMDDTSRAARFGMKRSAQNTFSSAQDPRNGASSSSSTSLSSSSSASSSSSGLALKKGRYASGAQNGNTKLAKDSAAAGSSKSPSETRTIPPYEYPSDEEQPRRRRRTAWSLLYELSSESDSEWMPPPPAECSPVSSDTTSLSATEASTSESSSGLDSSSSSGYRPFARRIYPIAQTSERDVDSEGSTSSYEVEVPDRTVDLIERYCTDSDDSSDDPSYVPGEDLD